MIVMNSENVTHSVLALSVTPWTVLKQRPNLGLLP